MLRFILRKLIKNQQLLKYDEAPEHVKFNPYIRTGYRSPQTALQCLQSVLQLHNETLNIWTHLLGFLAFAAILCWDVLSLPNKIAWEDVAVILGIITSYQACMILSAIYHTFTAHSKQVSDTCLFLDLTGIAASMTASYIAGIHYAFFCYSWWRNFYLITVGMIILTGVVFRKVLNDDKYIAARLTYFVLWAVYGSVPTIHWAIISGGPEADAVRIFLPRIVIMYAICGLAFAFYLFHIPERFFPGRFDLLGSSHQWWHVLIFCCLAYWHSTGFAFAEYRMESGCENKQPMDPAVMQRIKDNFWINF